MHEKVLASVPLFSGLDEDQLATIARGLKRRIYQERGQIFTKGAPGDGMYLIVSGKVKVAVQEDEDETIVAVLRAGDFFGELSVIDGEVRSANVVALEPTEVLFLAKSDFERTLVEVPEIAVALLQEVAGRLRRATSWIRALSSQDVYGRIAGQLLHLSKMHGIDVPSGRRIPLRLTQNDLAGIIGASRESVNKAMGFFKSKGVISVDSSYQVTIHDPETLRKRSQ